MTTATSSTQSVLDEMAQGIVSRKAEKAAVLTPVGSEKNGPLDGRHDAPFPYDDAQTVQQAIRQAITEVSNIREALDHVQGGLVALARAYGVGDGPAPVATPVMRRDDQRFAGKDPEPEAFEARMERLGNEAKTATFASLDAPATFAALAARANEQVYGIAPSGWGCPAHGTETVKVLTSRKGRTYGVCGAPGCTEFQK